MEQLNLFKLPQWKRVVEMLMESPKTTADFCSTRGLADEWRRAMTEARKKGYKITATRLRDGCFVYRLEG